MHGIPPLFGLMFIFNRYYLLRYYWTSKIHKCFQFINSSEYNRTWVKIKILSVNLHRHTEQKHCRLGGYLHFLFHRKVLEMDKNDVVYQASALTFDPSVVEMFTCFSVGAKMLITERICKLDRALLVRILNENKCTVLNVRYYLEKNHRLSNTLPGYV
jgi:hypothetical protein